MPSDYERQSTLLRQRIDAQVSPETAQRITKAVAAMVVSDLKKYPPLTSANRPPGKNGRWYERGFGTRTATGRSYPTSEKFNLKWKETQHGNYRRDLDNNASYGGYLQGNPQVAWAKARGWPNMKEKLQERQAEYGAAVARIIARVNRGQG